MMKLTDREWESVLNSKEERENILELKDGTKVLIRTVLPADKDLIGQGFLELGQETVRQRFHAPKKGLNKHELEFLVRPDGVNHFALGAVTTGPQELDGLGVARYVRLPNQNNVAELAVTVKDRYQGLGLGAHLLREICEHARQNQVTILQGLIYASNTRMVALLKKNQHFQLKSIGMGLLELYGPLVDEHLISGGRQPDQPHKKGKSYS